MSYDEFCIPGFIGNYPFFQVDNEKSHCVVISEP
jgi:hypothetical protein